MLIRRCALLLACLAHAAVAKDALTWMVIDFPPATILSGALAAQGAIDLEVNYLTSHLPDFDHVVSVGTTARAWAEMAHKDGVCMPVALKTEERERIARFSRVALIALAPGLAVRADRLDRFAALRDENGAVRLDDLAGRDDLTGVGIPARSYGGVIDKMLKTLPANRLLHAQTSTQAMQMLDHGRVDYGFALPTEGKFLRAEGKISSKLTILPVAGQPRLVYSFVACSNGSLGQKAIEQINGLLAAAQGAPPYFRDGLRWYEDADAEELLRSGQWQP